MAKGKHWSIVPTMLLLLLRLLLVLSLASTRTTMAFLLARNGGARSIGSRIGIGSGIGSGIQWGGPCGSRVRRMIPAIHGLQKSTIPSPQRAVPTALHQSYQSRDGLFAGLAEIGMGCSIGVLYSEYYIATTGCGPPDLGDALERFCYQGVIVLAGLAVFVRAATFFASSLEDLAETYGGPLLRKSTLYQVRIAEYLALIAVVGAVVALLAQEGRGATMDGLSGIDIRWCRAVRGDSLP